MRNNYTSVFFRKKFSITDTKKIGSLLLSIQFDDGFNAWINGTHIASSNMSTKEPRFNSNANSAIEELNFVDFNLSSPAGYLVEGETY